MKMENKEEQKNLQEEINVLREEIKSLGTYNCKIIQIVKDFLKLYKNDPGIDECREVLYLLSFIQNTKETTLEIYKESLRENIIKIKAIKKTLEMIQEKKKKEDINQ